MHDVDATCGGGRHSISDDQDRFVGRIVEHLHLEPIEWIVEVGYGLDDPFADVELVVDRQLDRDKRQFMFGEQRGRRRGPTECTSTPYSEREHDQVQTENEQQQRGDDVHHCDHNQQESRKHEQLPLTRPLCRATRPWSWQ